VIWERVVEVVAGRELWKVLLGKSKKDYSKGNL
jgi:hypothetical protein